MTTKSQTRACTKLAQGGALLILGVVLGLLVTSAYGGATNSTVPEAASLNNSVAAASASNNGWTPVTPAPTAATPEELLPPAKGDVASGDPLVRTNQLGAARVLEEGENTNIPSPDPTSTTFEERIRRLSDAVHRSFETRVRGFSSVPTIQVEGSQLSAAGSEDRGILSWEPPAPSPGATPELPPQYSKVTGYISTVSYDLGAEPNKFAKSSTKILEDGTVTGYTSSSRFTFTQTMQPAIKPSSVTMTVTSSKTYDIFMSGNTKIPEDPEDPEEDEEPEEGHEATVVTTEVKNTLEDKVNDAVAAQAEVVNTATNETETNAKLLLPEKEQAVADKRENEALAKNTSTNKPEDMESSMASQVYTVAVTPSAPRRRFRPTFNITTPAPVPAPAVPTLDYSPWRPSQWRGSTRYAYNASTGTLNPSRLNPMGSTEKTNTIYSVPTTGVSTTERSSTLFSPVTQMSVERTSTPENIILMTSGSTGSSEVVEPEMAGTSSNPLVLSVNTTAPTLISVTTPSTPSPTPETLTTVANEPESSSASPSSSTTEVTSSSNAPSTSSPIISSTPSTLKPRKSYTGSTVRLRRPSSSTTTPMPDTQAEESSVECTTTEETPDATVTPSSGVSSTKSGTTISSQETSNRITNPVVTSTRRPTSRWRPRTRQPTTTPQWPVTEEETTTIVTTLAPEDEGDTMTTKESVESSSAPTLGPPPSTEQTEASSTSYTTSASRPTSAATRLPPFEGTTMFTDTSVPATAGPDPVKAYLKVKVATTWEDLCQGQEEFKRGVADILSRGSNKQVASDRVVLLVEKQCRQPPPVDGSGSIPVMLYVQDGEGRYDRVLTESFQKYWEQDQASQLQITCVDLRYAPEDAAAATTENGNMVAVIAIAGVAAGCFLLLVILMMIMRKRQKRYNYGQRCTPVSLDAYSVDSVSVYNSVRRKGQLRASKRSYGNPAFEDPDSPSHPVNFAGLANCLSESSALHEEFALVPVVTARIDELPPGAETKNRYANVIPLPETRVTLVKRGTDPLSEYVNANFIRGPKNAPKYYIACQAPLESTISDFWRMVWEQQSKVILMLTDLEENGVEKCADYLPPSEVSDCHRRFGDFHVTLKKREVRDKYVVNTLQLKNMETNLWREITHMWFFGWPATGVPEEPSAVIAFLIEARAFMKANSGPTVVHCSPGTGRTGTVLACDLCIRDFEQSRLVDVPRVVHRLRKDRAGAVQTREQYIFIYQVLNLYAAKLTGGAMDSF